MATSYDWSGLRKLTIVTYTPDASGKSVGTSHVIIGDEIAADGLDLSLEANEQTIGSFNGDVTVPNGVNLGASTLSITPRSLETLEDFFPGAAFTSGRAMGLAQSATCSEGDVTIAFEKVCPGADGAVGVNYLLKHVQLTMGLEHDITRDDGFQLDLSFYPTWSPRSEYGETDSAKASILVPGIAYYGSYTYDNATHAESLKISPRADTPKPASRMAADTPGPKGSSK